jgi:hypothetical protein
MEDLATWEVKIEEPISTTYRDIEVFKLQPWQQGPVMLQALNMLEGMDLKAMGYNSPRYVHTLYQIAATPIAMLRKNNRSRRHEARISRTAMRSTNVTARPRPGPARAGRPSVRAANRRARPARRHA